MAMLGGLPIHDRGSSAVPNTYVLLESPVISSWTENL